MNQIPEGNKRSDIELSLFWRIMKLFRNIDYELLKKVLIITISSAVLGFGYGCMNFIPSHDYLHELYLSSVQFDTIEWKVSLGRFFWPVYEYIFGFQSTSPLLTSLFGFLWIAIGSYNICKFFSFSRNLPVILTCFLVCINYTTIALFATYLQDFGSDMMAMMLAVIAARCWKDGTYEKNYKRQFLSIVLLICVLGLYQAYLSVFVVLILIHTLVSLSNSHSPVKLLRAGLVAASIVVIAGLCYYFLLIGVSSASGIALRDGGYNSITNAITNNEPIYLRIINTYWGVISLLFHDKPSIWGNGFTSAIYSILIILLLYCIASACKRNQCRFLNIFLITFILIVLPLFCNLSRLINPFSHDLMKFSVWLLLLIPIAIQNSLYKHTAISSFIVSCAIALICFSNIQISNSLLIEKQIQYDASYSVMQETFSRIDSLPNYNEGTTPVVFIGSPNDVLSPSPLQDTFKTFTGASYRSSITYQATISSFARDIMRRDINIIDAPSDIPNIITMESSKMPTWPSDGSVSMIDGYVVVKFKEESE